MAEFTKAELNRTRTCRGCDETYTLSEYREMFTEYPPELIRYCHDCWMCDAGRHDDQFSDYERNRDRVCTHCGCHYCINDYLDSNEQYFAKPYDYRAGCETHCLACWLDPDWRGSEDPLDELPESSSPTALTPDVTTSTAFDEVDRGWPYAEVYEQLMAGEVVSAYEYFTGMGAQLAILPISRVHVERPAFFPGAVGFYPPGAIELDRLNIIPNRRDSTSLAEMQSAASHIDREVLESHPLVVCPIGLDWDSFRGTSHENHLEIIRRASEAVDENCLDFLRYKLCRIEPVDTLPGRAGQVNSNPMMAGLLLFNAERRESRIVGGAAFSHTLTKGLGLPMQQLEFEEFPKTGEVGNIVRHALSLYTALLEASSPTLRFIQALSILEFLADPDEYQHFEEVAKVISRYVARTPSEYKSLLDRFWELTSKKDAEGRLVGYRTKVVHIGKRIDRLIPDPGVRRQLFTELDGYTRAVIDHMNSHSALTLVEYIDVRKQLRPFETGRKKGGWKKGQNTNYGERLALKGDGVSNGSISRLASAIRLYTAASVPSKVGVEGTDFIQVANGKGYATGGHAISNTDWTFSVVSTVGRITLPEHVWTAAGGSIINIAGAYLTDASNNVLCWFEYAGGTLTLASGESVSVPAPCISLR